MNLRFEMRGDREGKAHVHAGRIAFDWSVEKPVDLGESDDLVKLLPDVLAAHAEDGAVEIDIFTAGQLGMKSGAHFEQTRHASVQGDPALRGLGDTAEYFQQGALAGPVAADDADGLGLA